MGSARTNLFLAYDAGIVRLGLEVLDKKKIKPNKQLLIAIIDIITRKGEELTRRLLNDGVDVVAAVRGYYNQNPLDTQQSRYGTPIEQRIHAARSYLIQKYILGLDVPSPEPLKITFGNGLYTNPIIKPT